MRPAVFLTLALSSLAAAQNPDPPVVTSLTYTGPIKTFNPTLTLNPTFTFNPTSIITLTTKPTTAIPTATTCRTTETIFQTQTNYIASTRTITSLTSSTVTTTQTVTSTQTGQPTPTGNPIGVHYDYCPYPHWPLSVIDFEYKPSYSDISDYRGLKWVNWAGFNYHYGYPDGWAPIPSNYTTGFTKTGGKETELIITSGPRAKLSGVHSFWFYYFEAGVKPDATNVIYVEGLQGGQVIYAVKLYTNTYEDGVWEHVCLDWNKIDTLRIVLPDCIKANGCGGSWFEIDDIWVRGRGQ